MNKCIGCHVKLEGLYFCSFTCAGLAGYFNVNKGWIKDPKELENKELREKLYKEGPFREHPKDRTRYL